MIKLPQLPYAENALEPHISANTINYHYHKHHTTYVNNLNKLLTDNDDYANMTLEEIILKSCGKHQGVFNNAAQIWNHSFYWHCMHAQGGGKPQELLLTQIEKTFTTFENFCIEFKNACLTQFGSGWAWLIIEDKQLKIVKTTNADTPMVHHQIPLLTCDVWEHAYYLDYQNKRPEYVDTFLNKLVNWNFVSANYQTNT